MSVDVIGFPDIPEEDEPLDRSLLEVQGPMRVGFGLRLAIRCSCDSLVPVNGFTDHVTCAGCGAETTLDAAWWQWLSGEEVFADAFSRPAGGGVEDCAVSRSGVSCQTRHRRQAPHCHGCQQPLPESVVESIIEAGASESDDPPTCPGCGAEVPFRPADELVRSLCPPALAVIGETLADPSQVREFYVVARVDDATRWHWLLVDTYRCFELIDLDGVRLPAGTLARLAEHEEPHTRAIAAAGEETPEAVLARLANDDQYLVRRAAAANPRLPASALPRLAADDDSRVRLAAARDPRTPLPAILELAEDSDSEVREVASRRRDHAWEEKAPCPVCGSGELGQKAPCPVCGARQVQLSPGALPEAPLDAAPETALVQLGGEVASPDELGFDLSLPDGRKIRIRTAKRQQLEAGDRVALLGAVSEEFDERVGGERLAAHQIPVVHARVVAAGADADAKLARTIAELLGGRLIPLPPGLRIADEPAPDAWRLRLTARLPAAGAVIRGSWPILVPVPLVVIFLGLTGGLNPVTGAVLGVFALMALYCAGGTYLNKPRITVDARTLRATPWPVPWTGARSVATDRVAQVVCRREMNGDYSLRAMLRDGEDLELTDGRYELEELFFIKRAVETVLGIQDRPVNGEGRPFGPHDRLALPETLSPRPRAGSA